MEPLSFASFSLAAILASLPVNGEVSSKPTITTHISPAIAGQWEVDLNSSITMTKEAEAKQAASKETKNIKSDEPKSSAGEGLLTQNEKRIINIQPSTNKKIMASVAKSNQCRELYNFATDNEMRAVSGKETTFGRYIVTHREEGLPIIAMKTTYDNNEPDCSGNQIDQTGDALVAFLKHDGNNMQWCADSEGSECFMDFYKVLP